MADIDPARFPDMNFSDLMQDGKIAPDNQGRAITRVINETIKRETAKKEKEKTAGSRGLASGSEDNPKWIHTVTLSPESFDQFLDEIWPSSVKRREIASQAAANAEPAAEPKPDRKHDRYGRTIDPDVRPTINRSPRD